jgi:hypothetical protein
MESNRDQRSGELSVADLRRLLAAAAELHAEGASPENARRLRDVSLS